MAEKGQFSQLLSSLDKTNDEMQSELENSLKILNNSVNSLKQMSKDINQSFDGIHNDFLTELKKNINVAVEKTLNQIKEINGSLIEFFDRNYESLSDQSEKMEKGLSETFQTARKEFMNHVGEHMGHVGESRSYTVNSVYQNLQNLSSEIGDGNVALIKDVIAEMDEALRGVAVELDGFADQITDIQQAISKAAIGQVRKSIGQAVEAVKTLLEKYNDDSSSSVNVKAELEKIKNDLALSYAKSKDTLEKMVNDAKSEMKSQGSQIRTKADETRDKLNSVLSEKASKASEITSESINKVYKQMEADLVGVFEPYIKAIEEFRDTIEDGSIEVTKPLLETLEKERKVLLDLIDEKREEIEIELTKLQREMENKSKDQMTSVENNLKEIYSKAIKDTENIKNDLNKDLSSIQKKLDAAKKKAVGSKELIHNIETTSK